MADSSIYWDIQPSLTYNALLNFIVGSRGCGKTYGLKKFVIKRFLRNKEKFIYVRRFKEEITGKLCAKFFDDIANEYPDNEFTVINTSFYIDGEHCGEAMCLSGQKLLKGIPFPEVRTIIFDEFILDSGVYRYLKGEVESFLEMLETVARLRDDVRVYLLSNALSVTNPYFLYFNIAPPPPNSIICNNDILIENTAPPEYVEAKLATRFGKLISGTKYGDYAISNQFLLDNNEFIAKKSGRCSPMFSCMVNGYSFSVWHAIDMGMLFVSSDAAHGYPVYSLTKDDHTPNDILISSLRTNRHFKLFIEQFFHGNVRFESINLKNKCYEALKIAHIY